MGSTRTWSTPHWCVKYEWGSPGDNVMETDIYHHATSSWNLKKVKSQLDSPLQLTQVQKKKKIPLMDCWDPNIFDTPQKIRVFVYWYLLINRCSSHWDIYVTANYPANENHPNLRNMSRWNDYCCTEPRTPAKENKGFGVEFLWKGGLAGRQVGNWNDCWQLESGDSQLTQTDRLTSSVYPILYT